MAAVAAEERSMERRRGGAAQPKLLVLDINGLLLDTYFQSEKRPERIHNAKLARFYVYKRPHCDRFVKFCLENFLVAVWSSAKEHNVNNLVDYVFGDSKKDLIFCWSQSHCTNSGMFCLENKYKPLFFKELSKVWECSRPEVPWEKGQYGPWNTLLIDDSPHKILRNPDHTAILPLAFSAASPQEDDFLLSLESYLERLLHSVNVQKFVKSNPFGQPQLSPQSPNWHFYLKAKLSVKDGAGNVTKEAETRLSYEKEGKTAEIQSIQVVEQQMSKRLSLESSHEADLHLSDENQRQKQSAGDTEMVHAGVSDEELEIHEIRHSRKSKQRTNESGQEEQNMSRSSQGEEHESRRSTELKHVHDDGDEMSRRQRRSYRDQISKRSRSRPWVSLPRFERHRALWYRDRRRSRDEVYDRRSDRYELEYDYNRKAGYEGKYDYGTRHRKGDSYDFDYDYRGTKDRNEERYEYSSRGTRSRRADRNEHEYDYSSRGTRSRKEERFEPDYHYPFRATKIREKERYEPEYDYNSRGSRSRREDRFDDYRSRPTKLRKE